MASVFDHKDYRVYLNAELKSSKIRGVRTRLADMLGCQLAFVSRVLSGDADLSQEHAITAAEFLNLTDDESDFFLLLHLLSRAGSHKLKSHYQNKINAIQSKRRLISERIQTSAPEIGAEDRAIYYSTWQYSAIHVMALVPYFQTRQTLSEHLKIPLIKLNTYIEFLQRVGLIKISGNSILPGEKRIHLPWDSPFTQSHHVNWRMRAIDSLDRQSTEDVHYSGPLCFSKEDGKIIREKILELLSDVEAIVKPSKEETVSCLLIDLFGV